MIKRHQLETGAFFSHAGVTRATIEAASIRYVFLTEGGMCLQNESIALIFFIFDAFSIYLKNSL